VDVGRWFVLLSPSSVLGGINAFLFDTPRDALFGGTLSIPDLAFIAALAIGIAGAIAVTLRRFQRITA
jgi:hypothetical protein